MPVKSDENLQINFVSTQAWLLAQKSFFRLCNGTYQTLNIKAINESENLTFSTTSVLTVDFDICKANE